MQFLLQGVILLTVRYNAGGLRYTMNIIIAGCGKVGRALAEQLSKEKHDITVIDLKPESIQLVTNAADVRGVVGNGASYDIQMDAGVDKADLMIAVTNADEVNLLCCLIAKKAGGCQTIARVRNPVYHHEIHHIKDELGLSMVINPEWAAAMEMARLLRFPSAIDIDTFANGRIELLRFQLDNKNPLCGHKIRDLDTLSKCEVLVCIVEHSGPYLVRVKFLQYPDVGLVMIAKVEVGDVEISVIMYYEDAVFTLEFSQIFTSSVIVESEHVAVEPYFPSAQC